MPDQGLMQEAATKINIYRSGNRKGYCAVSYTVRR
jgi:hypothetical protein